MSSGDERSESVDEAPPASSEAAAPEVPDELDDLPLDEGLGEAFEGDGTHAQQGRRRRLERLVPELLKRAIERGIEAGLGSLGSTKGKEAPRDSVPPPPKDAPRDAPARELGSVPKEIAGYVFSQIDDTKSAMVRVVAREVREFLEAADLSKELQKALTSLSFEIRTEIRFVPNDAGGIKPEVKAKVAPGGKRPPGRRPTAYDDDGSDGP